MKAIKISTKIWLEITPREETRKIFTKIQWKEMWKFFLMKSNKIINHRFPFFWKAICGNNQINNREENIKHEKWFLSLKLRKKK